MWEDFKINTKLLILSGESSVEVSLLAEDIELLNLIKKDASKETCLDYINENY